MKTFNKLLLFGTSTLVSVTAFSKNQPNIVYIFADQWRAQEFGFMGNENVETPNIDRLSSESLVFSRAYSNCPVSGAYRASLLTGTYPLTHGVFYNDKPLAKKFISIAEALNDAGYNTAYIGKWHLDGHGRDAFIPKDRRLGFEYWKARECTHDYNNSFYFADTPDTLRWNGYDAIAQTDDAMQYIVQHDKNKPFALFLSWGPPHDPYNTAPQEFKDKYKDLSKIKLRGNVPEKDQNNARKSLAGYYAHIAALDYCMGKLMECIKQNQLDENTIFIFTSDHGDMQYSHGQVNKQKPWDESINVPFFLRYPAVFGKEKKVINSIMNAPDIMPSILSLSGVKIPKTVEGVDLSKNWIKGVDSKDTVSLIASYIPFHQWNYKRGGREYRGIRTLRYTYVRDLKGPWILYDNQTDYLQLKNLVNMPEYASIQASLDLILNKKLKQQKDEFLPGDAYMKMWNYKYDRVDLGK
jgi:arylsulfatase A-like enzyme